MHRIDLLLQNLRHAESISNFDFLYYQNLFVIFVLSLDPTLKIVLVHCKIITK